MQVLFLADFCIQNPGTEEAQTSLRLSLVLIQSWLLFLGDFDGARFSIPLSDKLACDFKHIILAPVTALPKSTEQIW